MKDADPTEFYKVAQRKAVGMGINISIICVILAV